MLLYPIKWRNIIPLNYCKITQNFSFNIVKGCLCSFGYAGKLLDYKDKIRFEMFDVTTWETKYCNTHIAQYLKK